MRALIIEDSKPYVEFIKKGIEQSNRGFNEIEELDVEIINSKSFEEIIKNVKIDLFIVDVNIRDVTGCELDLDFIKYIKENYDYDFKYIIVSDYNYKDYKNKEIISPSDLIPKRDFKDYLMTTAIKYKIRKLWKK